MTVDQYKLAHWLNARKYTAAQLAERAALPRETVDALLHGDAAAADSAVAAVAAALRVHPEQLRADGHGSVRVVHQSAHEFGESRRSISRDGIPFYVYYTMVAPAGRVAPVVLDILCPADRLPALNNGHFEPAITVNLGPGDIQGRWGEELTHDTWRVMAANPGPDAWITGESYVEPSYCPHAYALATGRPARIVSYTAQSNLEALAGELNGWSDDAFAACVAWANAGVEPGDVLDLLLGRRGHDRRSLCTATGLTDEALAGALADPFAGLTTIRTVGRAIGVDYRVLLPAERLYDATGKTYLNLADTWRSKRMFGPYEVASMAAAPNLPDLTGLFMRIDGDHAGDGADLLDPAETHYLVTAGEAVLEWREATGAARSVRLDAFGSAWVGPFVRHRWSGCASLVRFGSGAHLGCLDVMELTNTFAAAATLRRCRRDLESWGYDG